MLPNPTKDIKDIVKYVLIAVAVAVILRFIIKNAKKINDRLKARKQQKEEEEEAKIQGYSTTPKFGESFHQQIAEQLKEGFSSGVFGLANDEESIYNAYGKIATGTPGDMIAVRAKFVERTGDDLFKETREELDKEELSNVGGILSNYPSKFRP